MYTFNTDNGTRSSEIAYEVHDASSVTLVQAVALLKVPFPDKDYSLYPETVFLFPVATWYPSTQQTYFLNAMSLPFSS